MRRRLTSPLQLNPQRLQIIDHPVKRLRHLHPRDHRRRRLHVGYACEVAFADLDQFAGGDQGVDLAAGAFLVQVQASGDFADGGGTALGVGGRGIGAGIAPGLSRILGDRLAPSSCAAGSG